MSADIYHCLSGEARERILWGEVAGSADELRVAALLLYVDMCSRQEEAGHEPTAAVWIGTRLFEPTVEELEEHDARAKGVLAREKLLPDEPEEEETVALGDVLSDITDDDDDELPEFTPIIDDDDDGQDLDLDALDMRFNSETDLEL